MVNHRTAQAIYTNENGNKLPEGTYPNIVCECHGQNVGKWPMLGYGHQSINLVNYNISLTWIVRPFGIDFPYEPWFQGSGEQGSVVMKFTQIDIEIYIILYTPIVRIPMGCKKPYPISYNLTTAQS